MIFTDEYLIERGFEKRPTQVQCYKDQRLDPDFVSTYNKGKDLSIMIQAGIWLEDRSNIHFLRRDESLERGGYSAASYLEVLEAQVPQIYEPHMIQQQDNASIYTARKVQKQLLDHGLTLLEWPVVSLDLNPIEHYWAFLKDHLNEHYLELVGQGEGKQAVRAYQEAIKQSQLAIGQELIDGCIMLMIRRVQAVIDAKGWYTKY